MNKKILIIAVIILALIAVVALVLSTRSYPAVENKIETEQIAIDDPSENSETQDTETEDTYTTVKTGSYIPYAKSSLTDQVNVIFFAASWCPSCAELDRNLSASLNSIPGNLTILKTDYDNSQDLREKYGVTIQHTLVQVDSEGNLIKKVNGLYNLYTLEDIITQFN